MTDRPDANNNPHLREELKRNRDADERFQASQQEMNAKAARIQSTLTTPPTKIAKVS